MILSPLLQWDLFDWDELNEAVFASPFAVTLASHLAPAFFRYIRLRRLAGCTYVPLRFGGTGSDQTIYNMSASEPQVSCRSFSINILPLTYPTRTPRVNQPTMLFIRILH